VNAVGMLASGVNAAGMLASGVNAAGTLVGCKVHRSVLHAFIGAMDNVQFSSVTIAIVSIVVTITLACFGPCIASGPP